VDDPALTVHEMDRPGIDPRQTVLLAVGHPERLVEASDMLVIRAGGVDICVSLAGYLLAPSMSAKCHKQTPNVVEIPTRGRRMTPPRFRPTVNGALANSSSARYDL